MSADVTLALDCSLKSLTLALLRDGAVVASYCGVPDQPHSVTLLARLDELLQSEKVSLSEISRVLFCNGPGGFSSLRVGLSTLTGLFAGTRTRCLTVPSLLFRCLSIPAESHEIVYAFMSAGRDRVYWGRLDRGRRGFTQGCGSVEELRARLDLESGAVAIGGQGFALFSGGNPSDLFDPVASQSFAVIERDFPGEAVDFSAVRLHYGQEAI